MLLIVVYDAFGSCRGTIWCNSLCDPYLSALKVRFSQNGDA